MHKMWHESARPKIDTRHTEAKESFERILPLIKAKDKLGVREMRDEFKIYFKSEMNKAMEEHIDIVADKFNLISGEELVEELDELLPRMKTFYEEDDLILF